VVCTGNDVQHPFVSPDGTTVVFASSDDGGPHQLFTVPIPSGDAHNHAHNHTGNQADDRALNSPHDTARPTLVSAMPNADDDFPSWSPAGDGTIVFQRTLPGGKPQLWVENVNSPAGAAPVFASPTGSSDTQPVYDPANPAVVVFVRLFGGFQQIFSYNLSTHALLDLSAQSGGGMVSNDSKPDFSPGTADQRIVFQSDRACGSIQLFTMSLDGTDQVPVFQTTSNGTPTGQPRCGHPMHNPVFSPSADALAYDSARDSCSHGERDSRSTSLDTQSSWWWCFGTSEIYSVTVNNGGVADGTPTAATGHGWDDSEPNWAPAGPPEQAAEAPWPIVLPIAAGVLGVSWVAVTRRRRLQRRGAGAS
jgi:Tol biopolymer transport system component